MDTIVGWIVRESVEKSLDLRSPVDEVSQDIPRERLLNSRKQSIDEIQHLLGKWGMSWLWTASFLRLA